MSVDRARLLKELQAELRVLVDDLRTRCDERPEVDGPLRAEWEEASSRGRTARSYPVWRDDQLTDVAVGWLLALVFVRFCEDNDLTAPPLLGGPERQDVARGHRELFFTENPGAGDREWLLEVFRRARRLPGLAEVLGDHSPVWRVGPTADGARRLIEFWDRTDETGSLRHDFTDPLLDTRFLGDLYQDLSESAKKQYALLQTPVFVEEFILDRTLDPAIVEFGLDAATVIDPTCGSGHFLLGSFARLSRLLADRSPEQPRQVIAQQALDKVAGVDLNPAAVAIARFRLLVAALQFTGVNRLADLHAFHLNVAVGDSLLHGRFPGRTLDFAADTDRLYQHAYASEDVEQAKKLLMQRYTAVVGNPPYITVKDSAMNAAYRTMFKSCSGKYALSVPFFERFFDLAEIGEGHHQAGFVGMITANSFMKRQMGKALIEKFIPTWDLTHVIDTSGAYIPGHGTPTVIIFGRNQHPSSPTVRGLLGTRGEPSRPEDPAKGLVWTSIVSMIDQTDTEDTFITATDLDRAALGKHPWSIGGGGAAELKERMDVAGGAVGRRFSGPVGFGAISGMDDVALVDGDVFKRLAVRSDRWRPLVAGDVVRDWADDTRAAAWFPYRGSTLLDPSVDAGDLTYGWPYRTLLFERATFSKATYRQEGRAWWEWHQVAFGRLVTPLSMVFAFVGTHNHFVLDRGGKVFKQSAPVIKLPEGASVEDHLGLLAVLNSATACFWMQQVFHNKGAGGGARVAQGYAARGEEGFYDHYEFDGTKLQQLPLPSGVLPVVYGELLDSLAQDRAAVAPASIGEVAPTRERLAEMHARYLELTAQMIAVQEELDWHVMGLYGLLDEDFTYPLDRVPGLALGERAFEIVMARQIEAGELETTWFTRHRSTPITELPAHWPDDYRALVERRIAKIESDRDVALIERPECKRRWASEPWDDQVQDALRLWLLDRLEAPHLWAGQQIMSTRALSDRMRTDVEFVEVAQLYRNRDVDLVALVTELVSAEAVPFLAAWRYTPSGMRTRREWEGTWELQRREDAGEDVGVIPVPPKYGKGDFAKASYWPLRGKLDVPKERFISYPGVLRENDPTLLVGWAGWNHLERASALAQLLVSPEAAARTRDQQVSLLAGLWELLPWLKQWHNDIDPTFGQKLGDFYDDFTRNQAASLGCTTDDLTGWAPPAPTKRARTT